MDGRVMTGSEATMDTQLPDDWQDVWNRRKICIGKMFSQASNYRTQTQVWCRKHGEQGMPVASFRLAGMNGDMPIWAIVLLAGLVFALVCLTVAGFMISRRKKVRVYRTIIPKEPTPEPPRQLGISSFVERSKRSTLGHSNKRSKYDRGNNQPVRLDV